MILFAVKFTERGIIDFGDPNGTIWLYYLNNINKDVLPEVGFVSSNIITGLHSSSTLPAFMWWYSSYHWTVVLKCS